MATSSELLKQAAALTQRAAELLEQGMEDEAARAQHDADQLMRRARRAMTAASRAGASARRPSQPDREVVVSALAELEVPASPKLVSAYAAARFGAQLRPASFASIRRDEQRAWRSPRTARAVYLAPALDAARFTPMRGLVTLSDWDLWRRLVGPRSARVDHLRALRNVARHFAWLTDSGADEALVHGMGRLVADMARTIPSVGDGWTAPDPDAVAKAAEAELSLLEEEDRAFRVGNAERARQQLGEERLIWGAEPLRLLGQAEA